MHGRIREPDAKGFLAEITRVLGPNRVLSHPEELLPYECDGLTFHRAAPEGVVFPASAEEVAEVVRMARRYSLPCLARGSGTGLSGGAVAQQGGIVIETSRMKRIGEIDAQNAALVTEPGVINLDISRHVAPSGFFYAPDPSSQAACTIGGNVAENSGGPHCLKYGTTVNHIPELKAVLGDGSVVGLGAASADPPGYDLAGLFVGSEGTFGIAVEIRLRLTRIPPATRLLLAAFPSVQPATQTVSEVIASGVVPAALEMMDRAIIEAVESSSYRAGYPRDAGAVLLIELEGVEAGLDTLEERVRAIAGANGASEVRAASSAEERAALWAGRKKAFGACGRLSPNMYLSDTVVPRNRLPDVLARVYEISKEQRIRVANVFHAGDGNLHPILLYDEKDPDQTRRMLAACEQIVEVCLEAGGCLSGEHGIGLDKRELMGRQFNEDDLEAMARAKRAFDPWGACNPGKILPQRTGCGEARRPDLRRLPEGVWV